MSGGAHKLQNCKEGNFALICRRSRGGGVRGGSLGHEAKLRLLDKFIKFTNVEGSIVAKAPFSLRVCGVFFKKDNSVYTEKNFMVGNQRERFRKDELKRNRKEVPEKRKIDRRTRQKQQETAGRSMQDLWIPIPQDEKLRGSAKTITKSVHPMWSQGTFQQGMQTGEMQELWASRT